MNETATIPSLPGCPIECQENNGQLMLHLPACPGRGLARIAGSLSIIAIVWAIGCWYAKTAGLTLLGPFLSVAGFIVFLFTAGYFGVLHWTKTWVTLSPGQLVVKTVLLGKETIERRTLTEKSRAQRRQGRNMAGRYSRPGGGSTMQWVEVGKIRFA